ncbi:MAG: AraC family transcriptional regulator [Fibrobacteres bacterium]|nr:AraC family transcriptional regulator [Fibrobacterota bacterium]
MKIEVAKRLLMSQRISIEEIGIKVGVDDPYYFSKLFKKRTGLTPKNFRKTRTQL